MKYNMCIYDNSFLSQDLLEKFDSFLKKNEFPNLLIYGHHGVGKTTFVNSFLDKFLPTKDEFFPDSLEINGSDETSVDFIREKLKIFTEFKPLPGNRYRVIFIDEAENLSIQAQSALRKIIDKATDCRFIFVVNNLSKVSEGIQSRCLKLEYFFDIEKVRKYLEQTFPGGDVSTVIEGNFPDIRAMIQELSYLPKDKPLKASILRLLERVVELARDKKFSVANNLISKVLISKGCTTSFFFEVFLENLDKFDIKNSELVLSAIPETYRLVNIGTPWNLLFLEWVIALSKSL